MNTKVVLSSTTPTGWSRATSQGSNCSSNSSSSNTSSSSAIPSPPSSELCALYGFAYRLGSTVHNNDPLLVGNNSDVRREAKLLMSLSYSSPIHTDDEGEEQNICHHQSTNNDAKVSSDGDSNVTITASDSSSSGRITPTHSVTSLSSGGSRRDTFCFTCPSLSLDSNANKDSNSTTNPGGMLSRALTVDDQDAMRLSSEAMARNVIESFQKAIDWRIQSWVESLSKVLVIKEMELNDKDNKALQQDLCYSNEALLVAALREIKGKVQALEATTAFKVLNKVSHVDETGSALKKRRMGEQEDRTGLEEGEYVYDVIHILEMQCSLNISSPAGNVHIDLNVPGKIKGTFLSAEDDSAEDKLTDVAIHLNTDMMASMIEKSSRIAVRVSTEALLKGEHEQEEETTTTPPEAESIKSPKEVSATKSPLKKTNAYVNTSASPTRSPKRKADNDHNVSGLVVITPARITSSSHSSFGESSDSDVGPVRLQIPNSFPKSNKFTTSQTSASRASTAVATKLDFAARLPPKKYLLQQKKSAHTAAVVTPLKTSQPEYVQREKGPNLPVLVEAACAAIQKKK